MGVIAIIREFSMQRISGFCVCIQSFIFSFERSKVTANPGGTNTGSPRSFVKPNTFCFLTSGFSWVILGISKASGLPKITPSIIRSDTIPVVNLWGFLVRDNFHYNTMHQPHLPVQGNVSVTVGQNSGYVARILGIPYFMGASVEKMSGRSFAPSHNSRHGIVREALAQEFLGW